VVALDAYRTDERPSTRTVVPAAGLYERFAKRAFDIVVSLVVLALVAPVAASVALVVRLTMGSKVLVFQERVGRGAHTFRLVKFRSTRDDQRPRDDVDRRHASAGRFIRRWSLDELPQFLNVLRGDMSLVGPRPEPVELATRCGLLDHPRHLVRPGLTGPSQVSTPRGTSPCESAGTDLDYVRDITFVGDLRILLRACRSIVEVRGS